MYSEQFQESLKAVEAARAANVAYEPARMTAQEKDDLLAAYHPDYKKTDFSYMRTGIMAGSGCPPELMRRAAQPDEMHMTDIVSGYGQTVSAPGSTMSACGDPLDLRCNTVGYAFPHIECKIIDPETGEESHGIPGTGGASFVAQERNGAYMSDECFKMSLTDAISVAAKALGIGADIYFSRDETKYNDKPKIDRKPPVEQPA